MNAHSGATLTQEQQAALRDMLSSIGLSGDPRLTPLAGGANNRAFRLDIGQSRFLLKVYFRHSEDPRDRRSAEFMFSAFAWRNGIRCIPAPVASHPSASLGLYEFIDGRPVRRGEVGENFIVQALRFFVELNRHRDEPEAQHLPLASEACFSIAEHVACVDRRVERLSAECGSEGIDGEARAFIRSDLASLWGSARDAILRSAQRREVDIEAILNPDERCISPSDFGFHNALIAQDGDLRFIDFEYAGWDDPAKLVCDFYCQPAVPMPRDCWPGFVAGVSDAICPSGSSFQRATLLLPAYRIKWACILLNDFLPSGQARRSFAGQDATPAPERKALQLAKARAALSDLLGITSANRSPHRYEA